MSVLAFRFARRELRGGVKGFRILVACLALGVAAIAASGCLRAAFDRGLAEDARALLGGDIDLRQSYQPLTPEQRQTLEAMGRVSEGLELRGMARTEDGSSRRLVELKGVDAAYPLVGGVELAPAQDLAGALAERDGTRGAVADPNLLEALGLTPGDRVAIGDAHFEIRASIVKEPDRIATTLAFGPRLMVAAEAVAETGLLRPGAVVRHVARLALAPGTDAATAKRVLAERFPEAGWQVRGVDDAAPGLGRFLDNLADFLTLVGLTALLVGGIGVANSVKATLDGRIATIAALKCLGASSGVILATYGMLVGAMAAVGIAIGLAVGALVPWAVVGLAGDQLPLAARAGFYPMPQAVAAGFGILTALVFTLWPLAQARQVPATALFRRDSAALAAWPSRTSLAVLGLAALALAALAVFGAERPGLAAGFVAASVLTMALFRLLAAGLARLAALASARRAGPLRHPIWRLALANLHRPGGAVVGMVLSLGLGLTVLATIALIEGNLARQFGETMPRQAPSFFFIDIQPDELVDFTTLVRRAAPESTIETAPLVRGRITRINGIEVERAEIAPEAQWAARGDRGLSSAATPPPGTRLAAGLWWPADYQGPPLASVEAGIAKGMGLKLGDHIGVNVLGRELDLTVASLRSVEWTTLNMNFTFIVSPNTLAGAPVSWIATVHAPVDAELAVEKAVTDRLRNVSAIRVKEALEAARGVIANADLAVRLAAAVTLAAGALVLAGAVMAGRRRRVTEAVILKVLGATRADLWRAWLLEFGLVGAVTGLAAGAIGTASAWAILTQVMHADWAFLPGTLAATLVCCIVASLLAGFAGTFVAIRAKAAPVLRAE